MRLFLPVDWTPNLQHIARHRRHRGRDIRREIRVRHHRRKGRLRSRKRYPLARVQVDEIGRIPRSEARSRTRPPLSSVPRLEFWPAHESSRSFERHPDPATTEVAEASLRALQLSRHHVSPTLRSGLLMPATRDI